MPSFHQRSYQKELLDGDNIPFHDIRKNMEELDRINHLLGGHAITIKGLKEFTAGRAGSLHTVEIGCGGGDNLRVLRNWGHDHGMELQLTGIDVNEHCIRYARSLPQNEGIHFICCDYRDAQFQAKPDLIFSSLFCHHFTEEELVFMLKWMKDHSVKGFFINDLHRHALAYHSIRLLTQWFSHSYLVKNDAPLSVQRGFRRKDWKKLFAAAGLTNFNCRWQWAFRWLITYHTDAVTERI